MADSACLTGNAAACNGSNDVKLLDGVCEGQGLTNDQLEGLQTEIVVDGTAVIVIVPLPGYTLTLATECFLLPVP